jgi:AraC-like DNA-binding protein
MRPVLENVMIRDGGAFACLEFRGKEFDCPYHFHPEIEITWILAGEGQRLVGDRLQSFSPGDLVMHGEGLPHMYRNWAPGFAHSRYIQFRRDVFGRDFFQLAEFRSVDHLLNRASRGIAFSSGTARHAQQMLGSVFSRSPGPGRIAVFLELLAVLAADSGGKPLAGIDYNGDPATSETARRILNYIEETWAGSVCLSEAARAAGLHPRSLSRFFRRRMGKTFQQYVGELRLGRAARELIESDRRISEIAFACGFNNLSNFNRLFLRRYGRNPGTYRHESV